MQKRILCYGDSNTWGYIPQWEDPGMYSKRYERDARWTGILAELLGEDYEIIEEGLNGRTTIYSPPGEEFKNGLSYLLPCLLSHRPIDIVILALGTNDLHLPYQPEEKDLGNGIREIIDVIQETKKCARNWVSPEIVLVSPSHIIEAKGRTEVYQSYGGEEGARLSKCFSRLYEQIAEEKSCRFLDAALYAEPSEADGVHWTAESHSRFASAVAKIIKEVR